MDWIALFLSLKLALVATAILMIVTAPLACLWPCRLRSSDFTCSS